ncbi:MAG: hypothetical protein ACT4PI_05880 [Actinomycetota bacterium]
MIIGTLGSAARAHVDHRGRVTSENGRWELDWWIGAEDRRHLPTTEAAVRQTRLGPAPVTETAMRVPGGDAVQRVYGVGGPGDLMMMEVENASPVPFAVAFVARGGPPLLLPRPPLRREPVDGGEAIVYPVAHRTVRRIAVALGAVPGAVDLDGLPTAEGVVRGWDAQLRRGMQVDLPDERVQRAVDTARADVLLAGRDVAALEDWGFDDEAAAAWARLSLRGRRDARVRRSSPARWVDVEAQLDDSSGLLVELRALLTHEARGTVSLLADLPPSWRGRSIEVHDAPTRAAGRISYAVRWHGERPALLWEVERPGVHLQAPGLDPEWSTTELRGEALLAPVNTPV